MSLSGPSREVSASAVVRIDDVRFRWPGAAADCLAVPALVLSAGERVFLHGPSGSGKSTLLALIGGVVVPERGRVAVQGSDLAALSGAARDRHRAEHLGFIFQMFNLVPYLSARDNILLACRFSPGRCARLAAAGTTPSAEAERLAAHLDLDPALLARPAAELSVGQQQRVAAARALIGRPQLVIADEPTSALDADRQKGFLELLLAESAAAGAAVLFVSHDARLAGAFDRVVGLGDINAVARSAA
jgi:putative ABC transport system ATP-binding protein